jgi:hypothetical protein
MDCPRPGILHLKIFLDGIFRLLALDTVLTFIELL